MALLLLLLTLPDLPEEDRLLAQARRGSREAVSRIYEVYFDAVYQFVRWRVDDPLQAEDLVSEVFIKFLSVLQTERAPQQSLRGWLFRVARNVLYDHYHQPMATTELDDLLPAPVDSQTEVQVLRALEAEQVRAALGNLPTDQQEVLILRFAQMFSLDQTAESMGRSVSAIKSLQFRAINALRRVLETAV
jgi:RNA polymerase sigma-70 factor (ECF subfamily)